MSGTCIWALTGDKVHMASRRISLTFMILTSIASILILTWALLSLISFRTAQQDLFAQKSEFSRFLLSSFTELVPKPLPRDGIGQDAERFAGMLKDEMDFASLLVVDSQGRTLYSLSDAGTPDKRLLDILRKGGEGSSFSSNGRYLHRYKAIMRGNKAVGGARLTLSLGREMERLRRSHNIFTAYFALDFLLLLGFGSFLLSRFVVSPIKRLLAATERITAGDYTHKVHVGGGAEIGELADSFNTMVDAIGGEREAVERHLAALEETNRQLKMAREETIRSEKLASVGILSAGMAHEIGTPLSAIFGYADILQDDLADDPVKLDYLKRITTECGRIDRIVRGLLDYARPGEAECEEVDISSFLVATMDLLEAQGIFKHIRTELSVESGLPPLFIDRHQLQQVLINLVLNARDAMKGDGALILKGGAGSLPEAGGRPCLRIEVTDSGEGIQRGNLNRIFDPFFTTKEPGKGTGLGLSISLRIVESFGGRITVESEPGKGTSFIVWLPQKKDNERVTG